jgi:hypothetical protein
MAWWPGWDSVDAAKSWSDFYFWFGIVCLFLLGASEVLSHYYGVRKDELVAIAESVLNKERTERDTQHDAETAQMRGQLRNAQEAAEKANAKTAQVAADVAAQAAKAAEQMKPRALTGEQRDILISRLSPFAGQKIQIQSVLGDSEGRTFADDFIEVFDAAHWDHSGPSGVSQAMYTIDPIGITITVSRADGERGLPAGINTLVTVLFYIKLINTDQWRKHVFTDPKGTDGVVVFRVGKKEVL